MSIAPDVLLVVAVGAGALMAGLVLILRRRPRLQHEVQVSAGGHSIAEGTRPPAGLRRSLRRTREGLLARLQAVVAPGKGPEERFSELEEILLAADVGFKATRILLAKLRAGADDLSNPESLRRALRHEMCSVLGSVPTSDLEGRPHVILVAGVNGVGKTTTIGKLAHRYRASGKTVLLVAADTFRAAASEQLALWANRVAADCVKHQNGADPSAVAFDGIAAALARRIDVVIIDTAGRLHVKQHLIEELKKIVRTIKRQIDDAPHEVLLVIDASTGQNAINQARVFQEAMSVTGVVLTKLDGTAKGGALFAIRAELGIPILYVGIGEQAEDLEPFDAEGFVDALLSTDV